MSHVKVESIIWPFKWPLKLEGLKVALVKASVIGGNIGEVRGFGHEKGQDALYRGSELTIESLQKLKIEVVVEDRRFENDVTAIIDAAHTRKFGESKIFISPVESIA